MFAPASGKRDGRFEQDTRSAHIFGDVLRGTERTGIELTTAAGICGAFELQFSGKLPAQGFVSQEEVGLDAFLQTRVGHYYRALAPDFDVHRTQASAA